MYFIKNAYGKYDDKYTMMFLNDSNLTSYVDISVVNDGVGYGKRDSIDGLDELLTSHKSLMSNKIRIYDITRSKYESIDNCKCISCD